MWQLELGCSIRLRPIKALRQYSTLKVSQVFAQRALRSHASLLKAVLGTVI